ncbi:hypothetical protein LTR97_003697 [Elasticomyces elasticus]|uniref:Major facilitator superfamily (MFS) profile domain-containing protein n=1 Tax=Elasticomyces elasticus TaxID=574655 RepID=A0AAN7WMZ3_9PEZI|nr:hypothetical protein LTR97_003697 [Elasticomyces elasticus]
MSKSTNLYYYCALACIACAGIPKGYDEGGFSASTGLASFKQDFNLVKANWKDNPSGLANRQANISSFGVLGAAFGSLIALLLNDRIGRLRTYQLAICVWATGILMQIFSSGILGFMLFARIWGGLGAGGLTVTAPLFLSEIAPAKKRGLVVSLYMVVLLSFLSLGFFINYAANKHMASTPTQYRLVQAIPLIPVGIAFMCSFFLTDTPRYLASQDRFEEAVAALARLRGSNSSDPAVAEEFAQIEVQRRAKAADLANVSTIQIFREIVTIPSYRRRFALVMAMQTVAQWSGGNGITYYIPQIFEYAGVTGQSTSLLSSGLYGIVKLVFTMVFAWGLIDIIGRRRCVLTGLGLQLAAHIYMACYMSQDASGNKSASDAAITSIFIYAVGWSVGLCTVQYLYGTEVFPTRIRSVSYATSMALHWFFQFAVVRVTPNMFVSLNVWGAYIFWALICAIGFAYLAVAAPETKGIPMERMGELFEGPWYACWKARLSSEAPTASTEANLTAEEKAAAMAYVEKV